MANVLLFVSEFELGTRISEALIHQNQTVEFIEEPAHLTNDSMKAARLAIIHLDVAKYASDELISNLRSRGLKVVGFMKQVQKDPHTHWKQAGCDLILPQSSVVKNIPTLVTDL